MNASTVAIHIAVDCPECGDTIQVQLHELGENDAWYLGACKDCKLQITVAVDGK